MLYVKKLEVGGANFDKRAAKNTRSGQILKKRILGVRALVMKK